MSKYLTLTGICLILLLTILCLHNGINVVSHAEEVSTPNYSLNFDNNELRLCGLQGLNILYYTDNVTLGLSNTTYGFTYNKLKFYFTNSAVNVDDLLEYVLGDIRILYEGDLDIQIVLKALRSNSYMKSVVECPELRLSSKSLTSYVTEYAANDYALIQLNNQEVGIVYRNVTDTGVNYAVSDNIKGDWWISPLGRLCFSDNRESFALDFTPISTIHTR